MKETALITGASGGLGLEFAKLAAKDGHDVVLVARSEDVLQKIAAELETAYKVHAFVLAKDLSVPSAAEEIAAELTKQGIVITMLINNAGFADFGLFQDADIRRQQEMIDVNILALTKLTRVLLPAMIAAKHGRILNVASTAAFQPGPLMSVYYATKAYVLSFSAALSNELNGSGVTVTCLCPGPTKTGFVSHAHMESSKLFKSGAMDAATVASIGYRGMMNGKRLVIPGLRNKLLAFATRFSSISLAATLTRRVQEPI